MTLRLFSFMVIAFLASVTFYSCDPEYFENPEENASELIGQITPEGPTITQSVSTLTSHFTEKFGAVQINLVELVEYQAEVEKRYFLYAEGIKINEETSKEQRIIMRIEADKIDNKVYLSSPQKSFGESCTGKDGCQACKFMPPPYTGCICDRGKVGGWCSHKITKDDDEF